MKMRSGGFVLTPDRNVSMRGRGKRASVKLDEIMCGRYYRNPDKQIAP